MTKKYPWVAAVLNFFIPGAGYLYIGKRKIFSYILLAGTIIAFSLGFVSGYKKEQNPVPWIYFLAGFAYNTAFGYDAFQESKETKTAKPIKSSKR